ncbi:unnamed protein product [Eruca vesicaria subsp. sativa]|uniref:BZIP domain-containing protein n=1 Tax=Eruca vesicaria subsp. sativa TaxID=29727 RepID=A0ABC8M6Z8_ERUVS|nr:unnamed protein product [Eruca vesicaria subsp. sativa]
MDGHAPPSYSGPTQHPTTPFGDATQYPPRGTSRPPTFQNGLTFSQPSPSLFAFPRSSPPLGYSPSAMVANKGTARPPLPMRNSSAEGSGGGMPGSVLPGTPLRPSSSSLRYSPPSPVVNKDATEVSPIPYLMGVGSGLPPRMDDDNFISTLNSLLAGNNPSSGTYPKPVEMPVGLRSQKKSVGNKRRAGKEIAGVSLDSSFNGVSNVNDAPPPPPQGVSFNVGNDNAAYGGGFPADQVNMIASNDELKKNAYGGGFPADQVNMISFNDELKKKAETERNKRQKRSLANRESAARSKQRKELCISNLRANFEREKVRHIHMITCTIYIYIYIVTLATILLVIRTSFRERMAAVDECARMRIRLEGRDDLARLCDDSKALNVHLTGELHRLTEEASQQREEANRQREEANGQREEANRQREEARKLREELNEYRRRGKVSV